MSRKLRQLPDSAFPWLPRIETILIENPETPASGCGEPPIAIMGAVVANAIFDATGARLRQRSAPEVDIVDTFRSLRDRLRAAHIANRSFRSCELHAADFT